MVEGPHSCFPINGSSKRQGCISSSTPEAEIVSAHQALKSILIPALDLWELLLPKLKEGYFHEDNQAMIQISKTGRNPTMKHLGRCHDIGVGFLWEQLTNEDTKLNVRLL